MKVINDLYDYKNYKIVQDDAVFKFSLDSILLAEFVKLKEKDKVLDICTGNAVVPLILSYYFPNEIIGFEIQKYIYELALESVKINQKENQIKLICDDVKNAKNYFPGNIFDVIVANPPYFKYQNNSLINENQNKAIARHELFLDLESLFQIVKQMLKEHGILYLVHLPERLEEIFYYCEKYKIIVKEVQFVYTKETGCATIVLLKCIKGASNSLKVLAPLYIENRATYQKCFRGCYK